MQQKAEPQSCVAPSEKPEAFHKEGGQAAPRATRASHPRAAGPVLCVYDLSWLDCYG